MKIILYFEDFLTIYSRILSSVMNKIERVTVTIDQCKSNLEKENSKPIKNEIIIETLMNRIRVFEDRKKKLIESQKVEKEIFESQQRRKRGRKRIK